MAIDRRRRALTIALAAAVLLLLIFMPVPMRVSGDAQVAPDQTQYVRAEQDGVVQTVLVHEGEQVEPGTPLAQMADWSATRRTGRREARYNTAMAQMARGSGEERRHRCRPAAARGQFSARRIPPRTEKLSIARPSARTLPASWRRRTRKICTGRKLALGDPIMEIVSTERRDRRCRRARAGCDSVRAGDPARIKLESFPTRTFRGTVSVVSPPARWSATTAPSTPASPCPTGRQPSPRHAGLRQDSHRAAARWAM